MYVESLVSRILVRLREDGRCHLHPFTGENLPVPERTASLPEYRSTFDWFPQPEELTEDMADKMNVVFHWKQRNDVQLFLSAWHDEEQCKCHLDLRRPIADGDEPATASVAPIGPTISPLRSARSIGIERAKECHTVA